ncbi:MAG: response regulator [Mariprofundaceae bacterium]|nr:response regulator [Mariprofundaceae bacterium]
MAHILIVDDNELNLELFRDVLELEGFEVDIATSGKNGVKKARTMQPDLVLMDMRMDGMDGLEAMRVLKGDASTSHILVAVLTASAMKGDKERLLAEGFDAYLQKPIDLASFADEVRSLLEMNVKRDN